MYNALKYSDKIDRLQNILDNISRTGTISMESADAIEREVPGVLSQHSDLLFDLDETEENAGIALEAGIEGLSRMKIAFIVAIVAFLAKYIMTLNKGYSFSVSGGGGGGWGGSAPPSFSTNSPPTNQKHWDDVHNANEVLDTDLEKLHSDFKDAFEKLKSQGINNKVLGGMGKNKALKRLCNVLIPGVIKTNLPEGTGSNTKGWMLFKTGSSGNTLATAQLKPFTDVTSSDQDVTDSQIKFIEPVLKLIADRYTVKEVFTKNYRDPDPNEKKQANKVNGLLIPLFILQDDVQAQTLELIKAITNMIDNGDNIINQLREFESVIKDAEQSKPDALMGGNYADRLWKWFAENLGKDTSAKTPIRTYLENLIKIQKSESYQGEYINTPMLNTSLKRFVRISIDGVNTGGDDSIKDIFSDMQVGDVEKTVEMITGTNGDIESKLTNLLPVFADAQQSLDDKENIIKDVGELGKEIEMIMDAVVKHHREKEKNSDYNSNIVKSGSSLDRSGRDRLETYSDGKTPQELLKNLAPMFNLASGLIQIILMSMASAAKYNTELSKFSQTRIDLIIGKKQEMAKQLFELTKTINQVINEASMNG